MAEAVVSTASPISRRSPVGGKTFAEFFAGIGLVREALQRSGWNCVYANDIDPKKRSIYAENFPDSHDFDERDIWDTEGVLTHFPTAPFLATSSFPCTDLSVAGDYRGLAGKESSTFFAFIKVIQGLPMRPRLLLFENVVGLLSSGGGKDFQTAVTEIADLGYRVDAFVINAQFFVPQSRSRIFIVGVHEDVKTPLLIDQPSRHQFGNQWDQTMDRTAALRPSNLRQLIENTKLRTGWVATPIQTPPQRKNDLGPIIDLDESQDWWDREQVEHHYEIMNDQHRKIIERMMQSKDCFVGTGYRRKRQDRLRLELRFDGVAGCLRTPRGGSGRQIVVVVQEGVLRMRWMSPREYARLQGAGDFKFVENERQMLFGFGDAVCVPVIQWIDDCVLTPIFESQAAESRTR